MTAEPRPVEEIRADIARQRHREVLARLAAADQENAELRAQLRDASDFNRGNCERANRAEMHADGLRRIRDKALAENAELRGEVGRARALCDRYGIVSLDDALAELDGARTEADEARADLRREQDAMATLYGGFAAAAEARDHAEAQVLIQNGYTNRAATAAGLEQQRADAAEARLEAVRAVCDRRMGEIDLALRQLRIGDASNGVGHLRRELAALSAAPQSEPDLSERYFATLLATTDDPAEKAHIEEQRQKHRAQPEPPASDEPARCEHDFHAINLAGERIGWRLAGAGSSERCPAASGTPDGGQR